MYKKLMQLTLFVVLLLPGSVFSMNHCISWTNYMLHTIFCPFCTWNCERPIKKLKNAIEHDDYKKVRYLLHYRDLFPNTLLLAKENHVDQALEPLVYAAELGHASVVDQLLKAGADPDSQMVDQIRHFYPSALIAVCKNPDLDPKVVVLIVASLLAHGADPKRTYNRLTDCDQSRSCNCKVAPIERVFNIEKGKHQHIVSLDPLKLAQENGYKEAAAVLKAYINK